MTASRIEGDDDALIVKLFQFCDLIPELVKVIKSQAADLRSSRLIEVDLRKALAEVTPSPSRGEMGTPITRCDNPLCECNRAASIAPGTRTVPCGCGCGRLLREDETENNEWSFVAPRTEEGATEWTAQDEAHLQHLSECHEPAWMGEVATRALAALRSSRRREEELRRVVDLVTAEGSTIKPSIINHGKVVVVDGRTGKDACAASAMEGIQVLLDEIDGLGSPGRFGITFENDTPTFNGQHPSRSSLEGSQQ